MASNKKDEQIEEAARRYHDLTIRPELNPMVSPEGLFREVTGRLPTATEALKIKKRIEELKSARENRKRE